MAKSSLPRANRSKPRGAPASAEDPTRSPLTVRTPPVGAPQDVAPGPAAVEVFERAMAALQEHNYPGALALFEELLDGFPGERALLDRARMYATVCQRGLAGAGAAAPATIEERLTAATAALNNRDEQEAERLVAKVLSEAPGLELGHYLLAVVHARRGATAAALEALRRAVALSPEVRAQAKYDVDFEALRDHDAFQRMMADEPAHSGIRRGAEPYSER